MFDFICSIVIAFACGQIGSYLVAAWDPEECFFGRLAGLIVAIAICVAVVGNG